MISSIKNEALAVGTVAATAAAGSVVYQNKEAINKRIITPIKDSFNGKKAEVVAEATADGVKAAKKTIRQKAKDACTATKNCAVKAAGCVKNGLKAVNWKTVGKVAGVAAIVSAAALGLKALYDAKLGE